MPCSCQTIEGEMNALTIEQCRERIDYFTERVAASATEKGHEVGTLQKIGISFLLAASWREGEGRKPTWYQRLTMNRAEKLFKGFNSSDLI